MSNDDKNVALSLLAGIGLGAIIGAATALMLAPKPGTETREDVKKAAEDLKVKAEEVVKDLRSSADDLVAKSKEMVDTTKSRMQQAVDSGKQAMAERKQQLQKQTEETTETEAQA